MTPGPVQLDDDILSVLGSQVQADYGIGWARYYHETTRLLGKVFETLGDIYLLSGSGSSGIDSCIGSSLREGEKILLGVNGFFGERLVEIAEKYGLDVLTVTSEWGKPLVAKDFRQALSTHKKVKLVAIVHLETSTTIVNPLEEIAKTVSDFGIPMLVDAVASLGGLSIKMDANNIALCASASQKCLGGPPGLAPIAINPRGWELINRNTSKRNSWYLDLNNWRQYSKAWSDWHPYPITLCTNNVVALRTNVEKLLKVGLRSRHKHFCEVARYLRQELRRIGFVPFTPNNIMAPVVTGVRSPHEIDPQKIIDYLVEFHEIKIAGGLGPLRNEIFRIGHMAPSVSKKDIDEIIKALQCYLKNHNG